jgi:hypothetical protein
MENVSLRGKKEGLGMKDEIRKLFKGGIFFFWYLTTAFKISEEHLLGEK